MENTDLTVSDLEGMIKALTFMFHTIWVVDKETLQMTLIHSTGKSTIKAAVQIGKDYSDFDEGFTKYIEKFVAPEDRERMFKEISSKEILRQLEEKDYYVVNYLRINEMGQEGYHQLVFANADVEGGPRRFVYGFRDIDESVRKEYEKTRALEEQLDIVHSVAKAFNVLYYVDMSDYSFIQLGVNLKGVEPVIGTSGNAKAAFERMLKYLVVPEQVEEIRKFVDLDTLDERLADTNWIAHQFCGPVGGWSEGIFIAANRDENGKCKHIIWATRSIDEMKRRESKLIYRSNTDDLTDLYNRRAFEEDVQRYENGNIPEDFVYVSIDINGLKTVNDTLGHAAGDELILGATDCLRKILKPYGKIYRTGGDEFIALLSMKEEEIPKVQEKIEEFTGNWHGRKVNELSLACGFVSRREKPSLSLHKTGILADQRMYKAKSLYYRNKGIDRRGQKDAHAALTALYSMILKVDITEDTFQIVDATEENIKELNGGSDRFSVCIFDFSGRGLVHPDDLCEFMEKTNLGYIHRYFLKQRKPLDIFYRRLSDGEYRKTLMEMIPANDYTNGRQTIYLYVRNVF